MKKENKMNLIKYRPNMLFNSIFDETFGAFPHQMYFGFEPKVDVTESEKDYRISFELPGVKKDSVKISLEDGLLTVEGEKKYFEDDKSSGSRRQERRYGTFKRSFRLGDGVDQKKISAEFSDGILEIKVAKNKESLRKEIEIKIN